MNVYMYVDGSELDEIDGTIVESISQWVNDNTPKYSFVNNLEPESDDMDFSTLELGIDLTIKKQFDLKEPLNFLNKLAKAHKINFVVGLHTASGTREDVCYFGHDEGKPDFYEIYTYLSL